MNFSRYCFSNTYITYTVCVCVYVQYSLSALKNCLHCYSNRRDISSTGFGDKRSCCYETGISQPIKTGSEDGGSRAKETSRYLIGVHVD